MIVDEDKGYLKRVFESLGLLDAFESLLQTHAYCAKISDFSKFRAEFPGFLRNVLEQLAKTHCHTDEPFEINSATDLFTLVSLAVQGNLDDDLMLEHGWYADETRVWVLSRLEEMEAYGPIEDDGENSEPSDEMDASEFWEVEMCGEAEEELSLPDILFQLNDFMKILMDDRALYQSISTSKE